MKNWEKGAVVFGISAAMLWGFGCGSTSAVADLGTDASISDAAGAKTDAAGGGADTGSGANKYGFSDTGTKGCYSNDPPPNSCMRSMMTDEIYNFIKNNPFNVPCCKSWGQCTELSMSLEKGELSKEFDSGCSIQATNLSEDGKKGSFRYLGADSKICKEMTFDTSDSANQTYNAVSGDGKYSVTSTQSGDQVDLTITLPSGAKIHVQQDLTKKETTISCPGGKTETYSTDDWNGKCPDPANPDDQAMDIQCNANQKFVCAAGSAGCFSGMAYACDKQDTPTKIDQCAKTNKQCKSGSCQ